VHGVRYLVIKGNIVRNVIEWDGVEPFTPPTDCITAVAPPLVDIGWLWNGGSPTDPNPPPAPSPPPLDQSDIDNLQKATKVAVLVAAQWAGKTPAQAKALFKTIWDALP
jgi:hypothetical protein